MRWSSDEPLEVITWLTPSRRCESYEATRKSRCARSRCVCLSPQATCWDRRILAQNHLILGKRHWRKLNAWNQVLAESGKMGFWAGSIRDCFQRIRSTICHK
jgi:hypothetical protein